MNAKFPIAVATLLLVALAAVEPVDASTYVAVLNDGSVVTGERLGGLTNGTSGISLDGKRLGKRRVTLSRLCSKQFVERPTAWLRMANGDLLPGKVQQVEVELNSQGEPPHLIVQTTAFVGRVRVRLDAVRSIHTDGERAIAADGVLLSDGRAVNFRSLRWRPNGIRLLADGQVIDADLSEIRQLNLPQRQLSMPVAGAGWFKEAADVFRLATSGGAVVTVPSTMISDDLGPAFLKSLGRSPRKYNQPTLLVTRPHWSLDPIVFVEEEISAISVLSVEQMPLTCLPMRQVAEAEQLGRQTVALNQGLANTLLSSGEMVSEVGIAVHAPSQLAFTLPPDVSTFHSWVGIDRRSGEGGCVRCAIYRDQVEGKPLWQSGYLQGSDKPAEVGPVDVQGATRLVLVVDAAHEGRPEGADPLDIRDDVNWLMPVVSVNSSDGFRTENELAQWIPTVKGWSLAPEIRNDVYLRPDWNQRIGRWATAMVYDEGPLILSRQLKVDLENGWLPVFASRDDADGWAHHVMVRVDGEELPSTMNGNLRTYSRGKTASRYYSLAPYAGQQVDLRIEALPVHKNRDRADGVIWEGLSLQPLVTGLSPQGQPIVPDVRLEDLTPVSATVDGKKIELTAGKCSNREPLQVLNWNFTHGLGAPTGSSLNYQLDPSYKRFVAVVGLACGWQGAGPYIIEIDGEAVWSSAKVYGRNDPGEQVNVAIPPGSKLITLRIEGRECEGAWAESGFLTK